MKTKASITLSEDILDKIDQFTTYGNRSQFIEKALLLYFQYLNKSIRDKKDLSIIDENADSINAEAREVLEYQIGL